jgi:hypothetical protein
MTRLKIIISYFFICFFQLQANSQDLRKAAIKYFLSDHNKFDNTLIYRDKIKRIEQHEYIYNADTIMDDLIVEKHLFDTMGNLEYVYKEPLGSDKLEMYYTYDAYGNLIKEEKYGISPELKYKLIQSFEWSYQNGFLIRQRRYLMANEIPTDNGSYGFPEKTFLFSNDTILYNFKDSSIFVIINNLENCKDVTVSYYPPNFGHVINTTLKFHPNNSIYSRTTMRDGGSQTNIFDSCGSQYNYEQQIPANFNIPLMKSGCLTPKEKQIFKNADTVTWNNQFVYIVNNKSSFVHHDSRGPEFINSSGFSYYNLDFKILYTETATTRSREENGGKVQIPKTATVIINSYDYYDNGLLKKIITKNEHGKILHVIEFKIVKY